MIVLEKIKKLFLRQKIIIFPEQEYVKKLNISINSFFQIIGLNDIPDSVLKYKIYENNLSTIFIDLKSTEEEIINNFDKKSCKYEINKAQKVNDKINIFEDKFDSFIINYNKFVEEKKFGSKLKKNDYKKNILNKDFDVMTLSFENIPVITHVYVKDIENKIIRLLYSVKINEITNNNQKIDGALNRYLHYEMIKKYKNDGYYIYDFGGISFEEKFENITKFKMSFGGEIINYKYIICVNKFVKYLFDKFNIKSKFPGN